VIPQIEGQDDFIPTMALLGPGLADTELPSRMKRAGRLTVGFTCRRDKQDTTAYQPPNLRKSPPHTRAEGGQVQTVLGGTFIRQDNSFFLIWLPEKTMKQTLIFPVAFK